MPKEDSGGRTGADAFEVALLGMNDVLLCGLAQLSPQDRRKFTEYVMDKSNWARFVQREAKPAAKEAGVAKKATKDTVKGQKKRKVKDEVEEQESQATQAAGAGKQVTQANYCEVGNHHSQIVPSL